MRDYGAPLLEPMALRWMRRFHNGADATLVPTLALQEFLPHRGFRTLVRLPRALDTGDLPPRFRLGHIRAHWHSVHRAPECLTFSLRPAPENQKMGVPIG